MSDAQSFSLEHGRWHFTLERSDGTVVLDAGDDDMGDLNRLTLLAAVRGLEAIDGASSVTLLSNNRYLIRSLSDSLPRWRQNDYAWEHFGRRIDVQHADLWRRIDRALEIHRVEAVLIASRLVSNGPTDAQKIEAAVETSSSDDSEQLRVDFAHAGPSRIRRSGSTSEASTLPKDQLRRWLLSSSNSPEATEGQQAAPGKPVARERFTAKDLAETA